ncbi:hypothetical protein P154DRAFT_574767 [Amniculicola lignicola CBS 123094]|uniref:Uncharacterized protein n=1 Tax=Amniculicola lignicola CBS 123094 TaxID=1392246 RepID=A0A6A5WLI3_9PLEO|nr:hypothetical protein P154DRAFT_574767 [Amniculicola lignicola CBS 123094]
MQAYFGLFSNGATANRRGAWGARLSHQGRHLQPHGAGGLKSRAAGPAVTASIERHRRPRRPPATPHALPEANLGILMLFIPRAGHPRPRIAGAEDGRVDGLWQRPVRAPETGLLLAGSVSIGGDCVN